MLQCAIFRCKEHSKCGKLHFVLQLPLSSIGLVFQVQQRVEYFQDKENFVGAMAIADSQ